MNKQQVKEQIEQCKRTKIQDRDLLDNMEINKFTSEGIHMALNNFELDHEKDFNALIELLIKLGLQKIYE